MDAHQRCSAAFGWTSGVGVQRAVLNRDGFFAELAAFDAENSEVAELCGQSRLRDHSSFPGVLGFSPLLHGTLDYSRLVGIARFRPATNAADAIGEFRVSGARSLYIPACFG